MLFHYEYISHPVDRLEKHVCYFIRSIRREAATRSRFNVSFCHPDFRIYVNRAPTLKKHLSSFFHAFRNLSKADQTVVYKTFLTTQSIKKLLENRNACYGIGQLPAAIRAPAKTLFKYLYERTLNSVGNVRDHYRQFYSKLQLKRCPFCGIESLLHYEHYKQDYDHLLCKDKYPFAAVNMKNLIPMGRDCNTIYKRTDDILYDKSGNRRTAFFPFKDHAKITISLGTSTLPSPTNRVGHWVIELHPNTEEVKTWEDLFCIKSRYKKDVLQAHYDTWLTQFIAYAKAHADDYPNWDEANLKTALTRYASMFSATNYDDLIFLRSAVCQEWINHADDTFYNALTSYLSP